jgi:putative flippase GtrA
MQHNLRNKLAAIAAVGDRHLRDPQLQRYFVMAVAIVGAEYASYLAMLWVGLHYLIAVVLSMAIAIILNWHFSRAFVFKNRRHSPAKEFTLVLAVSLVGVALQLIVSFVLVSLLSMPAVFVKLVAIVVTFFWNYWARKKYIF